MILPAFVFALLLVGTPTVLTAEDDDGRTCETKCSAGSFPHCGTWMNGDNSREASGSYLLSESLLNLSCVVTSLPRPVDVEWVKMTRDEFHRQVVANVICTSSRTITDCSFNDAGEHRVRSFCQIRLDALEQSGAYYCRTAAASNAAVVQSEPTHVQVLGIAAPSLAALEFNNDAEAPAILQARLNESIEVVAEICANPKPDVLWINEAAGVVLQAGHSERGYSALPLSELVRKQKRRNRRRVHHRRDQKPVTSTTWKPSDEEEQPRFPSDAYLPLQRSRFCYEARLIVSRVKIEDKAFQLVVMNSVRSLRRNYRMTFTNLRKSATAVSLEKMLGLVSLFAVVALRERF